MKSIFKKSDIDYIVNNYKILTNKQITETLGFTERQIRAKANSMGITKNRNFNKNYFHIIDTPNKAYWLGFIYADGYVICNDKSFNYELGIELKDTDEDLLKCLNNELGGVHKVIHTEKNVSFNGYNYRTHNCVIRVYSKQIIQDLISNDVVPNKTKDKTFPKCNNYFWDFVRGFMDGDGCIYVNPRNYISVKFVNANVDFLNYIKDTIFQLVNIKGTIYKEKENKYQLVFFVQKDVRYLLNYIYYDTNNQYLERKYNIYKSYYGFAS
ncbi:MAG: LAGLIDADG family homing endonuclease [Alistipes senegalensis]|nr:LAGLIDADG family homing endonuclease [Alistipes senegalensis]